MIAVFIAINLFLPGFGTLLMGNTKNGLLQLMMTCYAWAIVVYLPYMFVFLWFALVVALLSWIWAFLDGMRWLKENVWSDPE